MCARSLDSHAASALFGLRFIISSARDPMHSVSLTLPPAAALCSPRRYKPKKRPQQGSVQQLHTAAAHPAASDVSMHGAAASPRASQGGVSQTSPMMG